MPNKRRGFPTYEEAKKFLEVKRITNKKAKNWQIWDMKELYPRRKSLRFFVGDENEWSTQ